MQTFRSAPLPDNEERRLATLNGYGLLDTSSELLFDSLTRLAAQICATPIALIVLLDRNRQWFKSNVGFDGLRETSRDLAFCAYTILTDGIVEVADTTLDERFAGNPFVEGDPHIRFYAGVPLTVAGGDSIGTLCVADRQPRVLTSEQRAALTSIAATIVEQFEARRVNLQLLEHPAINYFAIDAATQRLLYVNESTERKIGYTLEELQRRPLGDILPALGEATAFAECLRELRDQRERRMLLRSDVQPKVGTAYSIDLRLEFQATSTAEVLVGLGVPCAQVSPDIERVELLSTAIDLAQDGIAIATLGATVAQPGTIVYVNEAFLRAAGAASGDVVGKPDDLFFGPKTDRAAIEAMRTKLRAGDTAVVRCVMYRADGADYYCEIVARLLPGTGGSPAHVIFVQRDVSNAVKRGMPLELLTERLTTLTEIASNLFASLDPRALVESLVAGVTELTGGGTASLLARGTGGEFIQTRDLSSRAETAVANDDFVRAAVGCDGVLLSPDGRRGGVQILAPSGIVSYLLDITAGNRPFVSTDAFVFCLLGQYLAVAIRNVELYSELASRRAAVVELNQVKNDLIAMLAHDFKGPLTTIVGLADVLAEDERFDAESRQFLGMINSSAMRLASLATDTLAFSRLEQNELSLRFERVDVGVLLRDIVRVFSVTRGIDIRMKPDELVVRADPARLRQVFENLIGNAIKYSPRGDVVDVLLRAKRDGVEVAIRDRGIGIPAADLAKLFGRFARGSNARELGIGGTGFGLFLARTIIELHGGRISFESKEGSGSTFRVFVPTVPAPQRTLDRRVLLLDSEPGGRSFIAHTLRDEGYAVNPVANEAELLCALDDGRYDAAIVDVDRLVITVPELVARIAHRATLVRLVTTAETESSGWNAALRKPFLIKDLQGILESAIAERRQYPRHAGGSKGSR